MSKKLTITNRINITLGLIAVFLLVLGTNRIDKRHFETVQNALTTVYYDRVLAQDYIYKMNSLIHKKRVQFAKAADSSDISNVNKELETLISLFATTELTSRENQILISLKDNFDASKSKEAAFFVADEDEIKSKVLAAVNYSLDALTTDLDNLALIQVSETKLITSNAQKSLDTNKLMSNMEIWFLLIIGISVQFIIFYRTKKTTKEISSNSNNEG
ncbi:MCP four helix bundle domain-containing protein [Patiriisocius sp. Uisw_017]|jgi:hypothetical protein|uniref:MCP four helix bundle domain-containing protein n=1 Tax=Patiriisocius sp. Uisw_017 TaxID=3230968 RepID=UPI0039E9C63B